jgi:hypothetical protein
VGSFLAAITTLFLVSGNSRNSDKIKRQRIKPPLTTRDAYKFVLNHLKGLKFRLSVYEPKTSLLFKVFKLSENAARMNLDDVLINVKRAIFALSPVENFGPLPGQLLKTRILFMTPCSVESCLFFMRVRSLRRGG